MTNRDGTSQFGRSQGRAPVEIDGRPIFLVQTSVGGLSLEERAEKIQSRTLNIAERNDIRKKMKREAENKSVNTDRLGGLRGLING